MKLKNKWFICTFFAIGLWAFLRIIALRDPGVCGGIVGRESIASGTRREKVRKQIGGFYCVELFYYKRKRKVEVEWIKKESRTKKILLLYYDSFSNREYVCRVLTPCLKRGAHTRRRRTSSKTTSVVVRKKERGGYFPKSQKVGDESNTRDESCVLTPAKGRGK